MTTAIANTCCHWSLLHFYAPFDDTTLIGRVSCVTLSSYDILSHVLQFPVNESNTAHSIYYRATAQKRYT